MREAENIEYLKELTIEQVNEVLREAHILINTSDYEGFSNTYIQAWMRKIPVVALNSDPDNILINKRIGFHSKTFHQMVKDVRILIENEKLRVEMGERARKYAISHFSVKNAEKFLDLLNRT
jgi:glycosyltransferase involved in cell wall biosynthesis